MYLCLWQRTHDATIVMDYSKLTLGQLLSSDDITIKRNAISILKVCQKCDHKFEGGQCIYCFADGIMCSWCREAPATIKDWREIDGTTGSYPSCKACYNLPTEEVLKIQNEWYKNNLPF